MIRKADLSRCGKYRWCLERRWSPLLPNHTITFVGLNPSTADDLTDDNTTTRLINFAKKWGYNEMLLVNLCAFRSTDPDELQKQRHPIGDETDDYIRRAIDRAHSICCCWGDGGDLFPDRCQAIIQMIPDGKRYCLGTTNKKQPRHPLYLPNETHLEKWSGQDGY